MTTHTTAPRRPKYDTAPAGLMRSGCRRLVQKKAFFPEKGASSKEARAVCDACPIQATCLEYALDHDERFGIWGGTSERERRALRRARRRASRARSTS